MPPVRGDVDLFSDVLYSSCRVN